MTKRAEGSGASKIVLTVLVFWILLVCIIQDQIILWLQNGDDSKVKFFLKWDDGLFLNSSGNNLPESTKTPSVYRRSYPILADHLELDLSPRMVKMPGDRIPTIVHWKNIVFKNSPFDDLPDVYYSNDSVVGCPSHIRCAFSKLEDHLKTADIVIVGYPEYNKNPSLPPATYQRPGSQLWLFTTDEAPCHNYHWDWQASKLLKNALTGFKDFFNLTMTYRLDSNISGGYGRFELREKPDFSRNYDRLASKTKTALFMSSYCGKRMSHRDEYVAQLQHYGLDVEILGTCKGVKSPLYLDNSCTRTEYWSTLDECTEKIGRMYKFYLSFENSLCTDYITEKFYRAASTDTIPVVFNAVDMSRIAPPNSYIDYRDFNSAKELVDYLKIVGSDSKLYNSYFGWKPYYDVVQTNEGKNYKKKLCRLCAFAHKYFSNPKPSVIQNIDQWWTGGGNCTEGRATFL